MTYKLKTKVPVKGPAWIIVPISESLVDRAVFNGCARVVLQKEYIESQKEFDYVAEIYWNNVDELRRLLLRSMLRVHYPPTDDECQQIEDYIAEHFKGR